MIKSFLDKRKEKNFIEGINNLACMEYLLPIELQVTGGVPAVYNTSRFNVIDYLFEYNIKEIGQGKEYIIKIIFKKVLENYSVTILIDIDLLKKYEGDFICKTSDIIENRLDVSVDYAIKLSDGTFKYLSTKEIVNGGNILEELQPRKTHIKIITDSTLKNKSKKALQDIITLTLTDKYNYGKLCSFTEDSNEYFVVLYDEEIKDKEFNKLMEILKICDSIEDLKKSLEDNNFILDI